MQNTFRSRSSELIHRSRLALPLALAVVAACSSPAPETPTGHGEWTASTTGVLVRPASGEAGSVRLTVMRDDIVRVTTATGNSPDPAESIMVVADAVESDFEVSESDGMVRLETPGMAAEVSLSDGKIKFFGSDGEPLLSGLNSGEFGSVTRDPEPARDGFHALRQAWRAGDGESWYGLGQHQGGQVDLNGENVRLTTHNMIITLPYLVSTGGWGILWDNNAETFFGQPGEAAPLATHFELRDADGNPGGLTVRYFEGDELLLERTETDLDRQFLARGSEFEHPLPPEAADAENLRIELEGTLTSEVGGRHELLMYSSGYAALSIDNETVLDRWRMNWNPWYHAVNVDFEPGEPKNIRLDWNTQGGYMRLLAHPPATAEDRNVVSFASDTGRAIDYYVVAGETTDDLVAGYRHLTGKSVMLPRWAYGFWQSRERYKSQDELLDALAGYRDRNLPIDNIVLDWSYWPVDAWGSHDFDPEFFPDPAAMVDEVHAMDARIMISVWPKFYPTTDHYKELDAGGHMLTRNIDEGNLDWIYPGYLNAFYDAWDPAGREMYWRQMDESLNSLGFDAWWLDAVEPDIHSNLSFQKRKWNTSPNFLGTGAEQFNSYAVPHAEAVYQGDRAASPDTRVFILTRSGFGGIQRTASAIWSGDIVSRWSNMKEQIAAGIGVAMAGVPNWTFDIGGFTPEDRFRYFDGGSTGPYTQIPEDQLAEWQELNTRWFQFGAFVPLFRSHGQNPYREIYNIAPEGSVAYESMAEHLRLRYRLMPYIYSIAGDMYHRDGTLMRGLAMDFPGDMTARRLTDQYLFGPAILVSPVHEPGVTARDVYLPEGTDWYDLRSGERHSGGRTVNAAAPLDTMPLFVRAGAIVPTGPTIQHSNEMLNAPLTINVWTGADGAFELYEDDGLSYDYENGEWSRIPLSWDEASATLTIGQREGGFPEMAQQREIRVRFIDGPRADAMDFDAGIAATVDYDGTELKVQRKDNRNGDSG